jgi:hypothetical protein
VLAGVIVVIVVLVMIVKALAGGGDGKATAPSASPSVKPATSAAPSDKTAAAPACAKEQLAGAKLAKDADILLTHDKDAYGPSEPVTLKAKVKNTSQKDCSLASTPENLVLEVVSGSDHIFNSSHCAAKASPPAEPAEPIIVKAGAEAEVPISWDAKRSQQGCPEITDTLFRAKDAAYTAKVTIAGVASDQTQFLLTP